MLTAVVTIEFIRSPEKNLTDIPEVTASTTCPPVTLTYAELFSMVGKNAGVLVMEAAGWVALRTRYINNAWTAVSCI